MLSKLYAIPEELRLLPNWCLWKYEWPNGRDKKPTKVPYQPNSYKCDVTNPSNWVKFDEAFNYLQFGGYDGLGFVFTNSGYAGIDLDDTSHLPSGEVNQNASVDYDRQLNIFREFNSYSECSPSGKGLHIIVKGSVPQGRRRSFVEIYSTGRYFTMTGDVYSNKPITDNQSLLQSLYEQMAAPPKVIAYTGNEPETQNDIDVINIATNASNGDKFATLHSGDWQSHYSSQSEADFAYIDIIAFYTQNRNQIARIFRASPLGQRDKAKRADYVNSMIQRSFDRLPPPVDTEGFKVALEAKLEHNRLAASGNGSPSAFDADRLGSNPSAATNNGSVAQRLEPAAHNGLVAGSSPATSTIQQPPGLLGEIAQFIYSAAPRPVPEISLAASIGLMAGICGRAYNVSGTGLNQYIMLLANTGTGKESIAEGIDKIINAVSMQVPVASEFIGPSRIASGQALYKYLANKSQCFVSIVGEFGKRLEAMSNRASTSAEKQLIVELLDLYNKSGHGRLAKPSIYSDQEKNTLAINAPAFSLLGESTPEAFYGSLTEEMITDGLLPRFMLIEYNGKRPTLNEHHTVSFPPDKLVEKIATLMANAKSIMANRSVIDIKYSDETYRLQKKFNNEIDDKMNNADKEIFRHLWNRAHLKSLKIAALVSVGINPFTPVIEADHFLWAKQIVENDIRALSLKFEHGEIGRNSEEIKQVNDMKRIIGDFVKKDWDKIKSYCNDQRFHSSKIIPHYYINKRLSNVASFRNDPKKASMAINSIIKVMLDSGILIEVSKKQMVDQFNTTQRAYVTSNVAEFM